MAMAILMLIGGMELVFKGRGTIMILLTFVPLICEIIGIASTAYILIKIPLEFCIAVGFIIGSASPGVLIPILIRLK